MKIVSVPVILFQAGFNSFHTYGSFLKNHFLLFLEAWKKIKIFFYQGCFIRLGYSKVIWHCQQEGGRVIIALEIVGKIR